MSEEAEEWRAVVGFEGQYEVSSLGRVKSLDRVVWCNHPNGNYSVFRPGRILRPGPSRSGHLSVVLGRQQGSKSVHVLVCEAFHGPKPKGMECLHWNDIPSDNRASNLRWGTRSENLRDAVRTGKKQTGEKHQFAKLKNADIPVIRSLFGTVSYAELGRRYGVNESTIRQIKDGKAWVGL